MKRARVIIANPSVPSVTGGSELFAARLTEELNAAGHRATLHTIPFDGGLSRRLLEKYCRAWEELDLSRDCDVVIPLRFPTWMITHPNKVVYLNHQLRAAYDLYGKPYGMQMNIRTVKVRDLVISKDASLAEARKIFSISKNVQRRLLTYNGLESELLYHGLPHEGMHRHGEYGNYILAVGRLVPMKRFDLLIRAMAETTTPVRCLIVGEGKQYTELYRLIEELRLQERVQLLSWAQTDSLIDLYAGALAVYYAPIDEDYGLVTLEAFHSGKTVVTAEDSGGVLEFVHDGVTGRVLHPEPSAFAEAIDELFKDKALARQLGLSGEQSVRHITWQNCVERLSQFF